MHYPCSLLPAKADQSLQAAADVADAQAEAAVHAAAITNDLASSEPTLKNFEGNFCLITGGSSGIGLALAKNLASKGANICILARDPIKLEAACQEISALARHPTQKIMTLSVDIAREAQTRAALQEFASSTARLIC